MRTLCTSSLVVLMILGWATFSGSAQNDDDDTLADLQTVVAEQGEEIERLGNRVATLEAAGDGPSPDGRPTEEADAGDQDETGGAGDGTLPIALGDVADVGEWSIRVVGYRPDATALVLAEGGGNPPPGNGRQYVLIKLEATFNGEGSASFYLSSSWGVGDDSGVQYDEFTNGCAFVPDGFTGRDDTDEGNAIEGNICFLVDAGDVEGLVLSIRPLGSLDRDESVSFALSEGE